MNILTWTPSESALIDKAFVLRPTQDKGFSAAYSDFSPVAFNLFNKSRPKRIKKDTEIMQKTSSQMP